MIRPLFALFALSICHATAIVSSGLYAAEVVEIRKDNWRSVAPQGKEADWILGDYVLRNDKISAVIAKPVQSRNANMTVKNVAGAIIDLTFRYRASDQLSCFYPGAAEMPFRFLRWREIPDGVVATVSSDWRAGLPELSVDYELKDGNRYITVTSRYKNPHSEDIQFQLRDAIRADRGFEHQCADEQYVCHDFWWRQAYGLFPIGHQIRPQADTLKKGRPLFTYVGDRGSKIKLAPGESYEFTRLLIPGEHDLDIQATIKEHAGEPLSDLAVVVRDPRGLVSHATIKVMQGEVEIGSGRTPEAGPLMLRLSPGEYTLEASAVGRGTHETKVTLGDGRVVEKIELSEPGYVVGIVSDQDGHPIPAKIQYRGNTCDDPDFGPDTQSYLVKNLQYTANGKFSVAIAPGTYDVIISRGPEYNADFQTVTIERGETTNIQSQLKRTVDTNGWVSSDFHSHSTPSGDNTSDQLGRVLNLLAEHIEFAPCTEHNRISSYMPHLKLLDAEQFLATCTGIELTGSDLPVNHQNAFPLHHHPHRQDGGGPTTSSNPVVQIERLAMWDDNSDKLVQENHPNLEQIWADQDKNGEEDEGFRKMFDFMDVIEIHPPADIFAEPGTKTGKYGNVIQSWLRMLNSGFRIPGVVNTDAHYNFHGSGWLRNYVKSSTDNAAKIETMEMVHESEHGHLVMTNGPFLEATASSNGKVAIAGDDLEATDGKVQLKIKVQCPNWFDVNRVGVLLNGKLSSEHDFTRRSHPAKFKNGVIKFEETVEMDLDSDTHIIVATIGDGLKLGPVMGPDHGDDVPVALTNPVFVDVDGNGFKPSGDLLGLPFPYKAE